MHSVEKIKEDAIKVIEDQEKNDKAFEAMKAAGAELWNRVIGIVRPAIRSIGNRPVIDLEITGYGDVGKQRDREVRWDHRCLPLTGDPWPVEDDCYSDGGKFKGKDLLLREDGKLVQFVYRGEWSRWQGSNHWWKASVTVYDTPEAAIDDGWVKVEKHIQRIADAVSGAAGSRDKSTKKMRARAERRGALAMLL